MYITKCCARYFLVFRLFSCSFHLVCLLFIDDDSLHFNLWNWFYNVESLFGLLYGCGARDFVKSHPMKTYILFLLWGHSENGRNSTHSIRFKLMAIFYRCDFFSIVVVSVVVFSLLRFTVAIFFRPFWQTKLAEREIIRSRPYTLTHTHATSSKFAT